MMAPDLTVAELLRRVEHLENCVDQLILHGREVSGALVKISDCLQSIPPAIEEAKRTQARPEHFDRPVRRGGR